MSKGWKSSEFVLVLTFVVGLFVLSGLGIVLPDKYFDWIVIMVGGYTGIRQGLKVRNGKDDIK